MKLVRMLVAAAAVTFAGNLAAQEVNFGIIATDSAAVQRERWEPFFDDMRKQTGLQIKAYYAPDYNGVIEGMRFNKVQVAWFGNKSAMEAVDRAQGEIFAQHNVDYRTAFKTVRNASHGANLQAVLARQLDVATNNTEEMVKLQTTKPELYEQLRVIWTSPLIPSDPFVWRKDLDPAVKTKIKSFMLNYAKTDPAEKAVLKNIYNYGGFRASSNAQLVPIRQLELFKDRTKVATDSALSTDEKTKKLADIDAKLAALGQVKD